jgi:hypothetical protein
MNVGVPARGSFVSVATDDVLPGDRVEYIGRPVFDGIINTGEIGWVTKVEAGWVFAAWPRSGIHSVPVANVRLLGPEVTRAVAEAGNTAIWSLLGTEYPPPKGRRQRDPYMNQGCHPEVVERVWDELGKELPRDCRAQAKGKPVLAHPETDRILAFAHGTAYALWLTPGDQADALKAGASTVMTWSGGSVTDLAERAGPGWLWGRWYADEPSWLQRAYLASGSGEPPA